MDAFDEELFSYLDHNEDGTLGILELQEGLQDVGVIQDEGKVGFSGAVVREMLGLRFWRGLGQRRVKPNLHVPKLDAGPHYSFQVCYQRYCMKNNNVTNTPLKHFSQFSPWL